MRVALFAGIGILVVVAALFMIAMFLWPFVVCCTAGILLLVGLWFLSEAFHRSGRGRRRARAVVPPRRERVPPDMHRGEDGWQE